MPFRLRLTAASRGGRHAAWPATGAGASREPRPDPGGGAALLGAGSRGGRRRGRGRARLVGRADHGRRRHAAPGPSGLPGARLQDAPRGRSGSGSSIAWPGGARPGRWGPPPRRNATSSAWRTPSAWRPAGPSTGSVSPPTRCWSTATGTSSVSAAPADHQRRRHLPVDCHRLDPGQSHPGPDHAGEADITPSTSSTPTRATRAPGTRWPCMRTAPPPSTAAPGSSWSTWCGGWPGARSRAPPVGPSRRSGRALGSGWSRPGLGAGRDRRADPHRQLAVDRPGDDGTSAEQRDVDRVGGIGCPATPGCSGPAFPRCPPRSIETHTPASGSPGVTARSPSPTSGSGVGGRHREPGATRLHQAGQRVGSRLPERTRGRPGPSGSVGGRPQGGLVGAARGAPRRQTRRIPSTSRRHPAISSPGPAVAVGPTGAAVPVDPVPRPPGDRRGPRIRLLGGADRNDRRAPDAECLGLLHRQAGAGVERSRRGPGDAVRARPADRQPFGDQAQGRVGSGSSLCPTATQPVPSRATATAPSGSRTGEVTGVDDRVHVAPSVERSSRGRPHHAADLLARVSTWTVSSAGPRPGPDRSVGPSGGPLRRPPGWPRARSIWAPLRTRRWG